MGWLKRKADMQPTLKVNVSTVSQDYNNLNLPCPQIKSAETSSVTDSHARSCLWGLNDFYWCGYKKSNLLPVKQSLLATNKHPKNIEGAIFIRLSGKDKNGNIGEVPVMAYVSGDTKHFYLLKRALIALGVIPTDFPQIGNVLESKVAACGDFKCESSTFNVCTHEPLPFIQVKQIQLHVDPEATPVAKHMLTYIPIHWKDAVKEYLDKDIRLGSIEKVPDGSPVKWLHRMVITAKENGSPHRTVDLSPLNKFCRRETHAVTPVFLQARRVSANTYKTVMDTWEGFHSALIVEKDRHLTEFNTEWGRYRYRVAPQGYVFLGDRYELRYDEIIKDVERKSKTMDDTILWDENQEEHWC